MRCMFHHAVVLIAVLALVVSAAAWRQCTGLQMAVATVSQDQHAHLAHSASGHDHGAMHHQHAMHDEAPPAAPATDDHGCQKCCSMCMFANALLPATSSVAVSTWTSVMFASAVRHWTGNLVAVDPGIPKPVG